MRLCRCLLAAPLLVMGVAILGRTAIAVPTSVSAKQYPLASLPITERIKVPVGPGWLEIGFGSVWITKSESKLLLRIDPATNAVVARIRVGPDPELGIGSGLGFIWIPDPKDRTIRQVDPATNTIVRTIPVKLAADPEGSIAIGEGSIWAITNEGGTDSGTLTRVNARTGIVTANIPVKPKSHAAIAAFGSVWVSSSGAGTVARVDPQTNAVIAEAPVRALPRFMVASQDAVWVLSQADGTLERIDPSNNRVVAMVEIGVPGDGGDLAVGDESLWVSAERVPLSQVDPHKNLLLRQFVGGRKDDTMRIGFGSAWIISEQQGELWRVDLDQLKRLAPRP
jgi:virginiamycin B lyase